MTIQTAKKLLCITGLLSVLPMVSAPAKAQQIWQVTSPQIERLDIDQGVLQNSQIILERHNVVLERFPYCNPTHCDPVDPIDVWAPVPQEIPERVPNCDPTHCDPIDFNVSERFVPQERFDFRQF